MRTTSPLSLQVELDDAGRLLPRITTLVTGRAFVIRRCEYGRSASGRATLGLWLDGPTRFHANLVARVRQVPGVLDVVAAPSTNGERAEATTPPFTVTRARVSTRLDRGAVTTDAAVSFLVGDERRLAAGEGPGPVAALASAFSQGLRGPFPAEVADLQITRVQVGVIAPDEGLGARVRVGVTLARDGRRWCAEGSGPDIVQSAVEALRGVFAEAIGTARPCTNADTFRP